MFDKLDIMSQNVENLLLLLLLLLLLYGYICSTQKQSFSIPSHHNIRFFFLSQKKYKIKAVFFFLVLNQEKKAERGRK
jgi:cell division protein FtsW (lipid II flippase)